MGAATCCVAREEERLGAIDDAHSPDKSVMSEKFVSPGKSEPSTNLSPCSDHFVDCASGDEENKRNGFKLGKISSPGKSPALAFCTDDIEYARRLLHHCSSNIGIEERLGSLSNKDFELIRFFKDNLDHDRKGFVNSDDLQLILLHHRHEQHWLYAVEELTANLSPLGKLNFDTFKTTCLAHTHSMREQMVDIDTDYINLVLEKSNSNIHASRQISIADLSEPDVHEIWTFRNFDHDGDGFISIDDLRHAMPLLGEGTTEADVPDVLRQMDINNDGKADFYEFCVMRSAREQTVVH